MSCWRVLELSNSPNDPHIPPLLIKTEFGPKTYTVFLTDLNNVWSENLDLSAIVERASQQESPIEVSKQDTTQLAILLEHVQKSLTSANDTTCRIARGDAGGIILNAITSLPEPLDSLRWKFYLQKRTSVMLRDELIMPLLVSSHIQYERVNKLILSITEKDKAITRLLDQFESSNLDLATTFPSIGGAKPGRRTIKREQAAKHVPALQPFHQETWMRETDQLKDSQIYTLALFQDTLSQCTPKVPPRLKSRDNEVSWWELIGNTLNSPETSFRSKPARTTSPAIPDAETSEDETEDEFETHEHFHLRESLKKRAPAPEMTLLSAPKQQAASEDETTENEDLDAPHKDHGETWASPIQKTSTRVELPNVNRSPSTSPKLNHSAAPKAKGFRIGGTKSKMHVVKSPPRVVSVDENPIEVGDVEDAAQQVAPIPTRKRTSTEATASAGTKPVRKPFKIGGKRHVSDEVTVTNSDILFQPKSSKSTEKILPIPESSSNVSRATPLVVKTEVAINSPPEEYEETADEKAERKRQELKRKNEELAKKQAQNKKKKRF